MESANRPCHARSKSSPVPEAEPWGDYISPCPSMILPCSGDLSSSMCGTQCGLGEALEGFVAFSEEEDDNRAVVVEDFEGHSTNQATTTTTLGTVTLPPKNDSSDSLYQQSQQQQKQRDESPSPPLVAPPSPTTPEGGYQKRGRFLVWPVSMDPPSMTFPFLGMTPQ